MFEIKSILHTLRPQRGIKNYFSVQKLTFKLVGIDITSESNTIFNPFLHWILMAVMLLLSILMFIYVAELKENIYLVTDIMTPLCQSILLLIKMSCFFWNKKKIVSLVRRIWLWNLKATGDEFQIILEENRKDRFYSLLYIYYVVATAVMALLSPVLVACISYMKGYGFMDSLDPPLKAAYHVVLDSKSYIGYLLAYIWDAAVISLLFSGSVSNDTLFSWFSHNVAAQFRILGLRFKTAAHTQQIEKDENKFMELIVTHIKYHQRVIELTNSFNDVFMVTVFFKYTISLLQIAFLVFQITRGSELSTLVYHILFLTSVALQLMMYCHGAQKIKDESTSIASAIYKNFQWHEMSEKSKKILLLPMARAQKPCVMMGIVFVVDLPLFLWVFKTSGSFFTMLKSLES